MSETAAPATTAAVPASDSSLIAQVTWKWFNDHMPGSPISQHVEAWNHLYGSVPKLIAALEAVAKP